MEKYIEEYNYWCNSPEFDQKTKDELNSIKNDENEIKERFYKNLSFGTAGLRGIIGAGTNRMNLYTVGKATQGLANYIKSIGKEQRGVAIAYDSRNMSPEFAEETANILNGNGIKTYIFESLRPVPELSFTTRHLNCINGIMITASHNPAKYNGYKVYGEDGTQIVPPVDGLIIDEVNKIKDFKSIKKMGKDEAIEKGLYNIIGKEVDDAYISAIEDLIIDHDAIKKEKDMKIVYTPLHGTGRMPVTRVLKDLGFENVYVVKEQEWPDGNFPTVEFPNPEYKSAFDLGIKLAKEKGADLVLATDPDSDRLGVYAKDSKTGEYMGFTGNMSGLLIAEYELSQKQKRHQIPDNGVLVTTIVSSNLSHKIAQYYHIHLKEVLTGFKYIGEQIRLYEKNKKFTYLFGFEESYGCLLGTQARDKDAIAAVIALCEAAAYYRTQGLTLWDQMINIYKKYGYFKEDLLSITMEGIDGADKIQSILTHLRNDFPVKIGKYKVKYFRDYQANKIVNMQTKEESSTGLPISNVLYYELEDDAWVCVRPSGTEPKIKFYIGAKSDSIENANKEVEALKEELKKMAGIS